jgi:hypothetical protein
VNGTLTAWELECLREIGVEGVVVDLATSDTDALAALAQTILELPRRRSRSEMTSPSLPRVSARAQVVEADDDDDDDDYDEGDDDSRTDQEMPPETRRNHVGSSIIEGP